jgi:hypothetical protein
VYILNFLPVASAHVLSTSGRGVVLCTHNVS